MQHVGDKKKTLTKNELKVVCFISQDKTLGERKKDLDHTYKATFPWRGCLFLSNLQHSDTVAVKDSPPQPPADTGSGRNDI